MLIKNIKAALLEKKDAINEYLRINAKIEEDLNMKIPDLNFESQINSLLPKQLQINPNMAVENMECDIPDEHNSQPVITKELFMQQCRNNSFIRNSAELRLVRFLSAYGNI